jgi:hypothetical protein
MEDLIMDLIDCVSDSMQYINDPKMLKHMQNVVRMAEGRLEYEALIRNECQD